MSNNPNFIASMSSDEIYLGQDQTVCLTDEVNAKALVNHTHSEYASTDHAHNGYAIQSDLDLLEDVVNTKASDSHTHSEYAIASHTHTGYATQIALDILGDEVVGKADVNHTHSDYAASTHTHTEYANASHNHDEDYASIDHVHNNYATTTALNELSTTVSGKANVSHSHDDVYTKTEIDTKLDGKSDTTHTHTGVYDVNGAAANALTSANAYTDSKIDALVGEGASTTLDTIGEISSAIEDNQDAIDLLNSAIGTKANASDLTSHTSNVSNPHNISLSQLGITATSTELNYVDGVTSNIQTQLNAKASSSHTHTASDVGAAASGHTHTATSIGAVPVSLIITDENGGSKYSYTTDDGINILTTIANLGKGVHTVYAQVGVTGNPKNVEAWRFLVHKTQSNYGWVEAFGSLGSVYSNYLDGGTWRGWKCLYDASNNIILWSGAVYMQSTNSNPQTITPSKKLSECRTGWLLLWSDYDQGAGANDIDFATTFIPKYSPSGGTWDGKAFLCDIPAYVGSDPNDTSTEVRIIKPIYVHDDCLKGSYQNTIGGRNDVVLRAVYEI